MTQQDKERSEWHYSSLLILGFFGIHSPDGKKLAIRSLIGLILFIAGFIGVHLLESVVLIKISAALMPFSILFIVYSNAIYLKSLDTLERLIQLTAFAASYGAVLVIAISIYALNLLICCPLPVVLILLAEPFRGISLYFISKSYS